MPQEQKSTWKSAPVAPLSAVGLLLSGIIGKLTLPLVGYGAVATAAGSFGMVAAVCATGGAIGCVATFMLWNIIDCVVDREKNRSTNIMLKSLTAIGSFVGAIIIGSLIFGAMANPIGFSVLAGLITFAIAGCALVVGASLICGSGACLLSCAGATETKNASNFARHL